MVEMPKYPLNTTSSVLIMISQCCDATTSCTVHDAKHAEPAKPNQACPFHFIRAGYVSKVNILSCSCGYLVSSSFRPHLRFLSWASKPTYSSLSVPFPPSPHRCACLRTQGRRGPHSSLLHPRHKRPYLDSLPTSLMTRISEVQNMKVPSVCIRL